eukprot:COSAG04_NODE_61_length_30104_cov_10.610932_13_plen_33_part_00
MMPRCAPDGDGDELGLPASNYWISVSTSGSQS